MIQAASSEAERASANLHAPIGLSSVSTDISLYAVGQDPYVDSTYRPGTAATVALLAQAAGIAEIRKLLGGSGSAQMPKLARTRTLNHYPNQPPCIRRNCFASQRHAEKGESCHHPHASLTSSMWNWAKCGRTSGPGHLRSRRRAIFAQRCRPSRDFAIPAPIRRFSESKASWSQQRRGPDRPVWIP